MFVHTSIYYSQTVDKCILDNLKRYDAFMSDMESSPKMFFFYQPRQFQKNELFMSVLGDGDKLVGKCLYFLRSTNKPVKKDIEQDATVLCGELNSNILETFEKTLSTVYTPLLGSLDKWGSIVIEKVAYLCFCGSRVVGFHYCSRGSNISIAQLPLFCLLFLLSSCSCYIIHIYTHTEHVHLTAKIEDETCSK